MYNKMYTCDYLKEYVARCIWTIHYQEDLKPWKGGKTKPTEETANHWRVSKLAHKLQQQKNSDLQSNNETGLIRNLQSSFSDCY